MADLSKDAAVFGELPEYQLPDLQTPAPRRNPLQWFRDLPTKWKATIIGSALVGIIVPISAKTGFYPQIGYVNKVQSSNSSDNFPAREELTIETLNGQVQAHAALTSTWYVTEKTETESCSTDSKTHARTCTTTTSTSTEQQDLWMNVKSLQLKGVEGSLLAPSTGDDSTWPRTSTGISTDFAKCPPKGERITATAVYEHPSHGTSSPIFLDETTASVSWVSDGQCDSTKGLRFSPSDGIAH